MPKIKVDHIVSFSSEDSTHVASNVLSIDTTKKWKCQTPGEKSANIVLQLEKASLISGIDIGNEHSAYVEVLVNRSSSTDDFKVLLVMSSFMTPLESRQSTNPNKVRMFTYSDLRSPERDEKWDRVKIVCTQPFNRRVSYGLSFVTLHSSDSKEETVTPTPTKIGNFILRPSSPDNLSAGNLFARRKELTGDAPLTAAAAIREASSLTALSQGSPKCKAKLKDVVAASKNGEISSTETTPTKPRNRNELLYSRDDEQPNTKIDKLIDQRNKEREEKQLKESTETLKVSKEKKDKDVSSNKLSKQDGPSNNHSSKASTSNTNTHSDSAKKKRKSKKSNDSSHKKAKVNKITKPFNELLSGVTFVISGIENPERSNIRTEALAMGAKYKTEWDRSCTHLICAFTNTPKFNQVKGKGKIVNRMWIRDCYKQRKHFPWRRYALDSNEQLKPESEDEIWEKTETTPERLDTTIIKDDSTDTEGEIEKIRAQEKTNAKDSVYLCDTDEEKLEPQVTDTYSELADFFSGKVFYIDKELSENTRTTLTRYITAYDGLLLDDPTDIINYVISSPLSSVTLQALCPDAKIVSPDWIWECHNAKELVSDDGYKL